MPCMPWIVLLRLGGGSKELRRMWPRVERDFHCACVGSRAVRWEDEGSDRRRLEGVFVVWHEASASGVFGEAKMHASGSVLEWNGAFVG